MIDTLGGLSVLVLSVTAIVPWLVLLAVPAVAIFLTTSFFSSLSNPNH